MEATEERGKGPRDGQQKRTTLENTNTRITAATLLIYYLKLLPFLRPVPRRSALRKDFCLIRGEVRRKLSTISHALIQVYPAFAAQN